ncbi:MAG: hypothetical protein WBF45_04475 [Acidobacteriaceae bacterium]
MDLSTVEFEVRKRLLIYWLDDLWEEVQGLKVHDPCPPDIMRRLDRCDGELTALKKL